MRKERWGGRVRSGVNVGGGVREEWGEEGVGVVE